MVNARYKRSGDRLHHRILCKNKMIDRKSVSREARKILNLKTVTVIKLIRIREIYHHLLVDNFAKGFHYREETAWSYVPRTTLCTGGRCTSTTTLVRYGGCVRTYPHTCVYTTRVYVWRRLRILQTSKGNTKRRINVCENSLLKRAPSLLITYIQSVKLPSCILYTLYTRAQHCTCAI